MLPPILKNINAFADGERWAGKITEFTLPKIGRKLEDYQGGGMDSAVQIDMGGQPLEAEIKVGGRISALARQVGKATLDGTLLRFIGVYEDDESGDVTKVEVVTRGRLEELDRGAWKPGEKSEETAKYKLSYYREIEAGRTIIEIDVPNFKYIVNGVDILAAKRSALEL